VLQQVGTPAEIYARPANVFVAAFIGAPGMNVLDATARPRANAGAPTAAHEQRRTGASGHGRAEVHAVGFRPEDARLVAEEAGDFGGVVALVEPLGPEALVHVRLDAGETVVVRVREGRVPVVEERVGLAVPAERLHAFGADGRRLGA
jgi:ABC-type sugar transport system ATPase subunit